MADWNPPKHGGSPEGGSHASHAIPSDKGPSLLDRLPFGRERVDPYASEMPQGFENDGIRYLDARPLGRPLSVPYPIRRGMVVLMVVAAVVGSVGLFWYFDAVVSAPSREAALVQENIARNVPLDLPQLSTLMPLGDEEVLAALQASGDTLFQLVPVGEQPEGGFEVVKLPAGVTVADAAASYAAGLDNVSAASATRLLNGAWRLSVSRAGGTDMYVGYADFKSHEPQAAITQAMAAEGIDPASATDAGTDELGNTYSTGTLTVDDHAYTWRISVVPLSNMYRLHGIPDTIQYVGIRFTTA